MSGSDSSSTGYGSGGGGSTECNALFEKTPLSSPVQAVISTLKVGDVLEVGLTKTGTQNILITLFEGNIAGSITSSKALQFITCMESGQDYVAEVNEINGGRCIVTIRPA